MQQRVGHSLLRCKRSRPGRIVQDGVWGEGETRVFPRCWTHTREGERLSTLLISHLPQSSETGWGGGRWGRQSSDPGTQSQPACTCGDTCVCSVAQLCPTLSDIMDCSLSDSSREEYWSGLPFPPPEDLPDPRTEPTSPVLAGRFFTTEPPGKFAGTWEEPFMSISDKGRESGRKQRCM